MSKRIIAAVAVAVLAAGVGTAYATTGTTASGSDGYTQVAQTRIYDSTHINGDKLMTAEGTTAVSIPTGLVPAGADSVVVNLTAASETAVNGDLDASGSPATPTTSSLNFVRNTSVANQITVPLGAGNKIYIRNHSAGTVRLVVDLLGYNAPVTQYVAPSPISKDFGATGTVVTGGSFNTYATEVGTLDVAAGTYQVTLTAKAAGDPAFSAAHPSVGVEPNLFLYDQAKNPSFTGDLLNIGSGTLPLGNHTADGYYSGTGVITLAQATTLHVIAFGYDADTSAGAYNLEDTSITLVPVG